MQSNVFGRWSRDQMGGESEISDWQRHLDRS